METLKPLRDLFTPDPRNLAFVIADVATESGVRQSTFEDEYREMQELELPASIPDSVRSQFAVARNVWLYGWFHWPLYVVAGSLACRCAESALRIRYRREYSDRKNAVRTMTIAPLMKLAVENGWLTDDGFTRLAQHANWHETRVELVAEDGATIRSSILESPKGYAERVRSYLPKVRNWLAHGDAPGALIPGSMHVAMVSSFDVIVQVLQ
jgi:hypothetical protein